MAARGASFYIPVLGLVLVLLSWTARGDIIDDQIEQYYPHVPHRYIHEFGVQLQQSIRTWNETSRATPSPPAERAVVFPCQAHPAQVPPPTSVHQLRPADIAIVGALGDSLTAGFGARANSLLTLFIEYRGVSFSIGGDRDVEDVTTVPNILEEYNDDLVGASLNLGGVNSLGARLNVAVSGAKWQDLDSQITTLVNRLRWVANWETKWKMVNILIGPNNLCDYCDDAVSNGPDAYAQGLENALDRLKAEVPRVLVNLMTVIDVTELKEISTGFCSLLHLFECSCAISNDPSVLQAVSQASRDYNTKIVQLSKLAKYNDGDQFAVVVQPWFQDTKVPRKADGSPDTSYFAPDCFHFSAKGHAAAAVGLWNNLMTRVQDKKTKLYIPGDVVGCPAAGEFIYTQQNSA